MRYLGKGLHIKYEIKIIQGGPATGPPFVHYTQNHAYAFVIDFY